MCDVLLCVILTELAAAGAGDGDGVFGAAENCTTIVGRENKLLHLRSTKWPATMAATATARKKLSDRRGTGQLGMYFRSPRIY